MLDRPGRMQSKRKVCRPTLLFDWPRFFPPACGPGCRARPCPRPPPPRCTLLRSRSVLRQEGGHVMCVGVGGSGRQSLARLAAFTCGMEVVQVGQRPGEVRV